MKRIAFFNSSKSWGGGEKWHFEMAVALRNYDFETVVFAYANSPLYEKAKNAGLECVGIKISNTSFLNPATMKNLSSLLKRQNLDAIILNMPADVKSAGVVAMRLGIKHVIYRRGSAIPIKNSFLNRYLFRNVVTEMIANSEETKRTVLQNNSKLFDADKITVIYNGIDCERYKTQVEPENHIFTIGNLARLSPEKGQKYLIQMAARLKTDGLQFKVLIGGVGSLENELKQLSNQLGLDDVVEFLGFVEDSVDFMDKIDVLVFPSLYEGFGYAMVEAKIMKKPVVAFDNSCMPEIIRNNIDGFLVPFLNVDALYESVLKLMNNKVLCEKMGDAGRQDVCERFSSRRSLEEMVNFLNRI